PAVHEPGVALIKRALGTRHAGKCSGGGFKIAVAILCDADSLRIRKRLGRVGEFTGPHQPIAALVGSPPKIGISDRSDDQNRRGACTEDGKNAFHPPDAVGTIHPLRKNGSSSAASTGESQYPLSCQRSLNSADAAVANFASRAIEATSESSALRCTSLAS